ncbi:hypothetical protein J622_00112 [Acinetobacter sp. 1564232]|nr:hypothetical protein J623_1040 [Acinetobacter sp. 1245249]EYT28559.1 hypothetical protein J622_00112 [Acinetobacter sp. 1564232]
MGSGCSRSVLISCLKKTFSSLCEGAPVVLPNKDKIQTTQEQDR